MKVYDLSVMYKECLDGEVWYIFADGKESLWLPANVARGPVAKLRLALNGKGMIVTGKNAAQDLLEKIDGAKEYGGPPPINRTGWNGPVFALPSGRLIMPSGMPTPDVIYPAQHGCMNLAGTLRGWQHMVGDFACQPLALFLMLLPLAAPLRALLPLCEDMIIELIASQRTEITVPGAIVGSVTGGMSYEPYHHAPFFHALRPPGWFDPLGDQLLVLHGAELIMAGKNNSSRANDARGLLSHEVRSNGNAAARPRTTLIIGRERIASLVGEDTDIGRLTSERIVSLVVAPERELGFFDTLPPDCRSVSELHSRIHDQLKSNHGTVYRRFLKRLVEAHYDNETELLKRLRVLMTDFRDKACVDLNDATALRAADAFGLAYAAGKLALGWKIFPKGWSIGPVLLECYLSFYEARPRPITFDEELEAITKVDSALHVGIGYPEPTSELLAAADIIVDHKVGRIELMLRQAAVEMHLKRLRQRRSDPQVQARLCQDVGSPHLGVKRRKAGGRVVCFRIPRS